MTTILLQLFTCVGWLAYSTEVGNTWITPMKPAHHSQRCGRGLTVHFQEQCGCCVCLQGLAAKQSYCRQCCNATACKWDTGNSSPLFPHKDRTNRLCIFVLCYCFGKQNFIAVVPDVTKTIKIELLTKPQIPHSASNQISSQTHLEYKATNNKGISIRLNWTAHLCLLLHGTKDFLSAKNLYSHLQSLSSPGFLHPAYKARL